MYSPVTHMRNVQEPSRASPLYILGVACSENMFMVLLYNGLCIKTFMMLPVVVLWSYIGLNLCHVNLNPKINYESVRLVNQYSMQIRIRIAALRCARSVLPLWVDNVTLIKMLRLLQWLPYIENTSWIAYISLQWQL